MELPMLPRREQPVRAPAAPGRNAFEAGDARRAETPLGMRERSGDRVEALAGRAERSAQASVSPRVTSKRQMQQNSLLREAPASSQASSDKAKYRESRTLHEVSRTQSRMPSDRGEEEAAHSATVPGKDAWAGSQDTERMREATYDSSAVTRETKGAQQREPATGGAIPAQPAMADSAEANPFGKELEPGDSAAKPEAGTEEPRPGIGESGQDAGESRPSAGKPGPRPEVLFGMLDDAGAQSAKVGATEHSTERANWPPAEATTDEGSPSAHQVIASGNGSARRAAGHGEALLANARATTAAANLAVTHVLQGMADFDQTADTQEEKNGFRLSLRAQSTEVAESGVADRGAAWRATGQAQPGSAAFASAAAVGTTLHSLTRSQQGQTFAPGIGALVGSTSSGETAAIADSASAGWQEQEGFRRPHAEHSANRPQGDQPGATMHGAGLPGRAYAGGSGTGNSLWASATRGGSTGQAAVQTPVQTPVQATGQAASFETAKEAAGGTAFGVSPVATQRSREAGANVPAASAGPSLASAAHGAHATVEATLGSGSPAASKGVAPLMAGRPAEVTADPAMPPAPSARSLLVRVPADSQEEAVQLRFLQRGEQIDVRVASVSESAARELREHLPSLVARLQQAGFTTERIHGLQQEQETQDASRRGNGSMEQQSQRQGQEQSHEGSAGERQRRDAQSDHAPAWRRGTAGSEFSAYLNGLNAMASNDFNPSTRGGLHD